MHRESGCQFPAFEAASLNNKFKQLWLAGIDAKLVFETHAGQAWGTLHVCLGEHPGHQQHPPHPHELPPRHMGPARQRRRERRAAARVVAEAAVKAAANNENEAEKSTESENLDETINTNKGQFDAGEAECDNVSEVTEIVPTEEKQLFVTDVDDEICNDEQYYDEIDPSEAFTCFQCKMEHFPDNPVDEGQKVFFFEKYFSFSFF